MAYELPGFLEERVASTVNMDNVRADFMCRPSVMLHVVPKKDGDMWCALLGDNLMEGVAGFGDSPNEAMWSFDKAWYEKARAKNPASPAKEGVSVSGADIEVMAGARYGDRNTISKRPVEVDKASPGLSPTAPSGERPAPPQPAKVTRAWVDELLTVVVLQPFIHEVHGSHRPKCIDAMISKFRSIGIRVVEPSEAAEGEPEGGGG